MPLYVFECRRGHIREVRLTAGKRDTHRERCRCGRKMKRIPTVPMATLWAGKFHSPWAKKKRDELGDIQW